MRNRTQTLYRKADVSSKKAIADLEKTFPAAELVNFVTRRAATAQEAIQAKARLNDRIYVATLKMSEFPEKDESSDEPKEDAPADDGGESEAPAEDSGGDEGLGDILPDPEFGGGEGGEEESMDPAEETVHILKQILDELKMQGGGGDLGGPEMGAEDPLALPDVGAPAPGEALPPPVEEKKPLGMGGPALGSVTLIREDVTDEVGNKALIAEAANRWPTHKVARIKRRGEIVLNGEKINLPERRYALVTLVPQQ